MIMSKYNEFNKECEEAEASMTIYEQLYKDGELCSDFYSEPHQLVVTETESD